MVVILVIALPIVNMVRPISLAPPGLKMTMLRGEEMAAELIDPIPGLAQKIALALFRIPVGRKSVARGRLPGGTGRIEDGGIITFVEVSVRLREEVAGKKFATISQGDLQEIIRTGAVALPVLKPGFEARAQTRRDHAQQRKREKIGAHGLLVDRLATEEEAGPA